jgi:5-methyltetrahydropteroyltriglutamate--homocysteine methyltransferase
MLHSTDRIYTTHVGSLARPAALLDLMRAAAEGRPVDPGELAEAERRAVAEVVARQRAAGLDMISDGEQTKTGFYAYIGQRLAGFEPRAGGDPLAGFRTEIDSFPAGTWTRSTGACGTSRATGCGCIPATASTKDRGCTTRRWPT